MSNWIEHFNKAVDLIPYRKAGGMYTKIAEEAYRAGFEAGIYSISDIRCTSSPMPESVDADVITLINYIEKQEAKVDKTKA